MIDEEIPLDQLMNFEDDPNLPDNILDDQVALEEQQQLGNENQHLNVGMVLIRNEVSDPVFMDWERRRMAEATRIWAKFFCPGNPTCLQSAF